MFLHVKNTCFLTPYNKCFNLYLMALGKNVKRLREAKGLTQEQLSTLTGGNVSQGAIAALEKRDSLSSRFASALAVALEVPLADLVGAPSVIALHPDDGAPEGGILVPEYRVSFSAGDGQQIAYDIIEESEPASYRLSWFQKAGIKPKHARRFKITGDSMEPLLYAGDTVLVDTGEDDPTRIVDGKVYAIRYGNDLRVKRLFRQLDGTLILRSENPAYRDEEVAPELAEEHITLLGRVRDKSGAGGL
ncbi:XRE family transcriptional regulator [Cupriavidus sp. 30B13]|uniref:XRE family transcriptional regulator n=1 Tax=Cupriavidus sp. 30B13 TaxID=3384241 RepID=UPI003B91C28E